MPARPRFYTMTDVGEILNVTTRQVRALLLAGDLRGIQVGGRNEWRIEHAELEKYIQDQYDEADRRRRDESQPSPSGSDDPDRVEHDDTTTS